MIRFKFLSRFSNPLINVVGNEERLCELAKKIKVAVID